MEGNFLTAGDLALYETRRMYPYGYECGGGYGYGGGHKRRDSLQGASITGVVLGGTALAVAIAAALGVNAASKARSKGNEKVSEFIGKYMSAEKLSRETWQNLHTPTITQYVDVQTGAGAFSGSSANALAAAINNNSGINSAIGGCNFLRVARYSAPQPCGCDTCGE
jgi:hypothetical protein